MKIVLIMIILGGFSCALGYVVGKMSGKLIEPEDDRKNCMNCKYGDLDWDEEPCDQVDPGEGCQYWEAMDD